MNNRRKQNKERLAKLVEAQHGAGVTVDPTAIAAAMSHARLDLNTRPSSIIEPVNIGNPMTEPYSTPTRPLINTPLGTYEQAIARRELDYELRLAREQAARNEAAALQQASYTHLMYTGLEQLPVEYEAQRWGNAQITDNGALTAESINRSMEMTLTGTPRAGGRRIRQG